MKEQEINNMKDIVEFHCPRYEELPEVFLYKDQVIIYVEDALKALHMNKTEKLLTPTMLNNYVKQRIVSPPKDKKYNKKHLAYLIVVCALKQVFTLNEICNLIKMQIDKYSMDIAYNYFCIELEKAIKAVFETRDFSEISETENNNSDTAICKSAAMSFAHKIFTQKYINECC